MTQFEKDYRICTEIYNQMFVQLARGNGKSLLQQKLYEEILKGDSNMGFKKFFTKQDELASTVGDHLNDAIESANAALAEYAERRAQEEEEWVWVKGYKGTNQLMYCRDVGFELDKQFDMPEDADISLCNSGFHFCTKLHDVFQYYSIGNGNRFFEVEALVRKDKTIKDDYWTMGIRIPYGTDSKRTSKSIRFIRELTVDEVFNALSLYEEARNWTEEQKKRAMMTDIATVRSEINIDKLVALGYSLPVAMYIAKYDGYLERALAVGSQPDLSMDIKMLTIFMKSKE